VKERSPKREIGILVAKIGPRRGKMASWSSKSLPDGENRNLGRQDRFPTAKIRILVVKIGARHGKMASWPSKSESRSCGERSWSSKLGDTTRIFKLLKTKNL
jgi:hypothetical protein